MKRIIVIDNDDTILAILSLEDYDFETAHDAIVLMNDIKVALDIGAKKERLRYVKPTT